MADRADAEQSADEGVSLRSASRAIVVSSVLSLLTAVTDSLTLVGLSHLLTGSVPGLDGSEGWGKTFGSAPILLALVATTFVLNYFTTTVREGAVSQWQMERRLELNRAYKDARYQSQIRYSGAQLSSSAEQTARASQAIGAIVGLVNSVVRATLYLAIALASSWLVAVVSVVAGGALVAGLRVLSHRTRAMHRTIARRSIEVGEATGELAGSARELHQLDRWELADAELRDQIHDLRHLGYRSSVLAGMVGPIYWGGTVLVGMLVAAAASAGISSTADLAAAGLLLLRALNAGQGAQTMYQGYNDSKPYVDRIASTIAALREQRHVGDAHPRDDVELSLDRVSLSHGSERVVHDVTATFSGVGGIALVGPSGSGKTSILTALGGYLEPDAGDVRLAQLPLGECDRRELARHIGTLPQDTRLIKGTLRSNLIRPGVEIDDDHLYTVLDEVGLSDTVAQFAEGLDTPVGRAAEGFSGGELQRLGLARLILNDPPIWLLDEPTSALDRANSARVARLIEDAMGDHLVILVTHRPDLLAHCKRVLVVVDGRIQDDGPIDEVAKRHPFLAAMLDDSKDPETIDDAREKA